VRNKIIQCNAKKIRLIIIRHGETEWNRKEIFRGISDIPLSKNGELQVKKLALRLKSIPISSIYSSRLERAWKTAQIISENHKPKIIPKIDNGLLDINFGILTGISHKEAEKKFPIIYKNWFENPEDVNFPGGENLKDVKKRVQETINRIVKGIDGENVILVTHHVVIRTILCHLLNIGLSHFRQFEIHPSSISEARFEHGRWVLYRINDISHLLKNNKS
jgi:broad specificity phosphatase PhoE